MREKESYMLISSNKMIELSTDSELTVRLSRTGRRMSLAEETPHMEGMAPRASRSLIQGLHTI